MNWLGEIAGVVVAALVVSWLTGFLNRFVPCPARSILALKNVLGANKQSSGDRFRFVLCWLENDRSGDDTRIVAQAFSNVQGIALIRSARVIKASGAADDWLPAMQRGARGVLERWHADLAVVGLVKKSGEALSLWFVPRSGGGTLMRGDQPYELDKATLGAAFHGDLQAQLVALALAAVAPLALTPARGRVLDQRLRKATEKLSNLLHSATINEPEWRAQLLVVLGNAHVSLGERDSSTTHLERAVKAYNSALEWVRRESMPLNWAMLQNSLGNALWVLGKSESSMECLEQAVEAHSSALEVHTRERVPLKWAMTQHNLGTALCTLGELKIGTEGLEQAVEAHSAALEVHTRERVPLDWAMTQKRSRHRPLGFRKEREQYGAPRTGRGGLLSGA